MSEQVRTEERDVESEIDSMFDQLEDQLSKGKTLQELADEEEKIQAMFDGFEYPHRIVEALQGLVSFDLVRFKTWVGYQSPAVQRAASTRPPNRIYRHADGPLCSVYGYARYTGRMIVKCVESGLELRDVEPTQLTDMTKTLAQHFGVVLRDV